MNTFATKTFACVAAALTLATAAGSALAQPYPGDGRDGRFEPRNDRHAQRDGRHERRDRPDWRADDRRGPPSYGDRQDVRPGREMDRRGFPSPHADWRRGGRVPPEFRGRNYVVNDYRQYQLNPPPRGYQWVGVGGDFVLAAVATGIIAQIVSGQMGR